MKGIGKDNDVAFETKFPKKVKHCLIHLLKFNSFLFRPQLYFQIVRVNRIFQSLENGLKLTTDIIKNVCNWQDSYQLLSN